MKYDIERNSWSECPKRFTERGHTSEYTTYNNSSLCVNGKLYLFFGEQIDDHTPSPAVEKLDIKAHIEG